MKNHYYIGIHTLFLVIATFFSSCEKDLLHEEQYKKVIYLKSKDQNFSIFPHRMNDSLTTGYVTVGAGGTRPLDEDIIVTLALDEELLADYNYRNFGENINAYFRLVDPTRYSVLNYDVVLKKGNPASVAVMAIEIDVNGLSPDSTYIIPFRIASVSGGHEVNKEKQTILYQLRLENDYSNMASNSYKMRGERQEEGKAASKITAVKQVLPLAYNKIRMFPENIASSTVKKTIEDRAIVVETAADYSVRIKPYKNIEIENLGESKYNPETREFILNYQYRIPEQSKWIRVKEILSRVE